MEIAPALTQAMKEQKLTDTQLGAALGVSAQTVRFWRKGSKRPRSQHFISLIKLVPGFGILVGLEAA